MKKILSIILAGLTLFLMGSCSKELNPVYNPDDALAPEMGSLIKVAEDDSVRDALYGTISFDAADFGLDVAVRYTVYVDAAGNGFANQKAVCNKMYTPDNGNITYQMDIQGKDLNNALLSLGFEALVSYDIEMVVAAEMMGTANTVGVSLVSEMIPITVIPFNAEKVYPRVYVIGSYCGWDHSKTLFLHSYAEDKENYVGVVDFGEDHSANEFKITGAASWDESTGNWGPGEDADTTPEVGKITLVNNGGNITNYKENRYYAFHFVKSALTLEMLAGFDKVGIIGLNGDWENDIVMEQLKSNQKFYADIEVAAATEFKFRLDADWAVNWGGKLDALEVNGGNIPVEPGNYRVYLDLNDFGKPTAKLSTMDYGKSVGGEEEPEVPAVEAWGLIGDFNGWDEKKDVVMKEIPAGSGIWVSGAVTFENPGNFLLRWASKWDKKIGVETKGAPLNIDKTTPAVEGGQDIGMAKAGTYVVVYDSNKATLSLLGWGLIGQVAGTGWDYDVPMTKSGAIYKAYNISFEGKFKLRYSGSWDEQRGSENADTVQPIGEAFSVIAKDGADINVPAGTYDVSFDPSANKLTLTAK